MITICIAVLEMIYGASVICLFASTIVFLTCQDKPSIIEIPGYFILSNLSDKNIFGKITSILAFMVILPYSIAGSIGFAIAYILWLLWIIGKKH